MLTGENGILTQAQRAKTEAENAQAVEEERLNEYEKFINSATGTNTEFTDGLGNKVVVPAGFEVVNPEDNVDDGIIIKDSSGNEFVWIPVTDEKQYKRNTSYINTDISVNSYTDTGYLPDGIQPEKNDSTNNENAEKTAITSKGGFYISRYEAGKEEEGETNKLVSKSGATVWNNISQEDCKKEARKFINNTNVKSAHCSGIQWDITMAFINGKEDGSSDADKTYNVTQYKASRHTGVKTISGQNPADRVCNIFDLEGNYREYIAEMSSYDIDNLFIHRGGSYTGTSPASDRYSYNGSADPNITFRFVLYIM